MGPVACIVMHQKKNGQKSRRWIIEYIVVLALVLGILIVKNYSSPGKETTLVDEGSAAEAAVLVGPEDALASIPSSAEFDSIKAHIEGYTGIRILSTTVGDIIRIEYLLQPRRLWERDSLHNTQMYRMICALRQENIMRHPVIFAGLGRFKDATGTVVYRSRLETKLQAMNMNRIDCDAASPAEHQVNWFSESEYYYTYAIPEDLIEYTPAYKRD